MDLVVAGLVTLLVLLVCLGSAYKVQAGGKLQLAQQSLRELKEEMRELVDAIAIRDEKKLDELADFYGRNVVYSFEL